MARPPPFPRTGCQLEPPSWERQGWEPVASQRVPAKSGATAMPLAVSGSGTAVGWAPPHPAAAISATAAPTTVHSRRGCIRPTNRRGFDHSLTPMASDDLDTLARLRGLLDVSRVVRDDDSLPEVLSAIARTISESLGYQAVVVNLYRPAWDDFEVTTVRDRDPRSVAQLLGSRGSWADWAPLLDERFKRRGAYFVSAGEHDWSGDMLVVTPDIPISDDPN